MDGRRRPSLKSAALAVAALNIVGCSFPASFEYQGDNRATLATSSEQTSALRITQVNDDDVLWWPKITAPELVTVIPGEVVIKLLTWDMPGPTYGSLCVYLTVNPGDRIEFVSGHLYRKGFQITAHRIRDGKRTLLREDFVPYSPAGGRCPLGAQKAT